MALKKIYRPKEVDQLFGWSPSTRKRKIQEGEFRKPLQLGPQMVGWEEEYLEEYRKWLLQQNQERAHATAVKDGKRRVTTPAARNDYVRNLIAEDLAELEDAGGE